MHGKREWAMPWLREALPGAVCNCVCLGSTEHALPTPLPLALDVTWSRTIQEMAGTACRAIMKSILPATRLKCREHFASTAGQGVQEFRWPAAQVG